MFEILNVCLVKQPHNLPKARSSFHATLIGANGTTDNIVQYVGASGVSFFKYGTAGKLYVGHFSYPVAE